MIPMKFDCNNKLVRFSPPSHPPTPKTHPTNTIPHLSPNPLPARARNPPKPTTLRTQPPAAAHRSPTSRRKRGRW